VSHLAQWSAFGIQRKGFGFNPGLPSGIMYIRGNVLDRNAARAPISSNPVFGQLRVAENPPRTPFFTSHNRFWIL
jgi:hypothetical protein